MTLPLLLQNLPGLSSLSCGISADNQPILHDKSKEVHLCLLSRTTCLTAAHHPWSAHRPHALCLQLFPLLDRENPPDRQ